MHVRPGGTGPLDSISIICSMSILINGRGGNGLLFKNGTINGYAYQLCYCPGWICIERDPWHFGNFHNIFLPIIGKDQKKSHNLSARPLALCHTMVNPALVCCILSIKRLDEGLREQILEQKVSISPGLYN